MYTFDYARFHHVHHYASFASKTKSGSAGKARLRGAAKPVYLAAEAIRAYIESNEWQIAEIQAALQQADDEDSSSEKDIGALRRKWKLNEG